MSNPNIVSVASIYAGNASWNLSASRTTTLMTIAQEYIFKINSIICVNVDGTNAATLDLYISGLGTGITGASGTSLATTCYLAKTVNVPPDDVLVVLDTPIYMMEGDQLNGGTGATGDLDLFISYEAIID